MEEQRHSEGCKPAIRAQKRNPLREKSYAFAINVVHFCRMVAEREKEFVLTKQLLRSGTSIGANVAEALHAQSKRDFIAKLSIALKEANESYFWLELIRDTKLTSEKEATMLISLVDELISLLVVIIKTSKNSLQ